MEQKLKVLYNTLALIETKGEGTKLMAQCLIYVDNLAKEARNEELRRAAESAKAPKADEVSEQA